MGVHLPDTIVFARGVAIAWYWSEDGEMKKKNKEDLLPHLIVQSMELGLNKDMPAAYFISTNDQVSKVASSKGEETYGIEYVRNVERWYKEQRNEHTYGFLQKFVVPFQMKNSKWILTIMKMCTCINI